MMLKKIVLRGENSTMSTNEMKLVLGGQVIDNGVCGLKNDKCSGGCAIQYVNGNWTQGKCTMSKSYFMGIVIYSCNCI